MSDHPPKSPVARLLYGCIAFLASVIALCLALELLAQIWGWLLLIAAIAGAIWLAVIIVRRRQSRQW
jgi:hypothetical protein